MAQRRRFRSNIHLADDSGNLTTTATGATARLLRTGGEVNQTLANVGLGDSIDVYHPGKLKAGDWVYQLSSTNTLSTTKLRINTITYNGGNKDWTIAFNGVEPAATDIDFSDGDRLVLDYDEAGSKIFYFTKAYGGSAVNTDLSIGTDGKIDVWVLTTDVDLYVNSATIGNQYITDLQCEGEICGSKWGGVNLDDDVQSTTWEIYEVGTLNYSGGTDLASAVRLAVWGFWNAGADPDTTTLTISVEFGPGNALDGITGGSEVEVLSWVLDSAGDGALNSVFAASNAVRWRLEADFIPISSTTFEISAKGIVQNKTQLETFFDVNLNLEGTAVGGNDMTDATNVLAIKAVLAGDYDANTNIDYAGSTIQVL
jgi:hypothetical protein